MNILAVIKGLNKLLEKKEKEQEDPVPQKEVDEELVIKDESLSESPKTSPIQGAGVSSFLELSDSALTSQARVYAKLHQFYRWSLQSQQQLGLS